MNKDEIVTEILALKMVMSLTTNVDKLVELDRDMSELLEMLAEFEAEEL